MSVPDFLFWSIVDLQWCANFYSIAEWLRSVQLHPTLCDPMDCSTPGFPVHHQLPDLAQTHVHWVSDASQPSHPVLSPFPAAFNLSRHQGLSSESVLLIRWWKYWSFSLSIHPSNEYSGLTQLYTCIHSFFFLLFPTMVCTRNCMDTVPCAVQ